eukprot:755466-Hanusia_phi.AAC.4
MPTLAQMALRSDAGAAPPPPPPPPPSHTTPIRRYRPSLMFTLVSLVSLAPSLNALHLTPCFALSSSPRTSFLRHALSSTYLFPTPPSLVLLPLALRGLGLSVTLRIMFADLRVESAEQRNLGCAGPLQPHEDRKRQSAADQLQLYLQPSVVRVCKRGRGEFHGYPRCWHLIAGDKGTSGQERQTAGNAQGEEGYEAHCRRDAARGRVEAGHHHSGRLRQESLRARGASRFALCAVGDCVGKIMVVNFYTPWCHWCQKLEPVWEKSAQKFAQAHPDDSRLVLAKVDCTSDKAESLCTKYHIDAFPSIMVFRKDDPLDKDHEKYHGERSIDAIVSWAEHLMKQVNLQAPKSRVVDKEQDGEKESHNGVGCMVSFNPPRLLLSLSLCPLSQPDKDLAGRRDVASSESSWVHHLTGRVRWKILLMHVMETDIGIPSLLPCGLLRLLSSS